MPPRVAPPEGGGGGGDRGGFRGGGDHGGGRGRGVRGGGRGGESRGFSHGSNRGRGGALPAGGPSLSVGHAGPPPPLPAAHVEAIGVRRPGYRNAGTPIRLYSNNVAVELTQGMIYHYDGTSNHCPPSLGCVIDRSATPSVAI